MERILPSKSKLCRLCLTESVVYYSLFEDDRAVFLETLTSIKIDEEESLPTNACIRCCLSLKYAFQIQQNILEADRKLRLLNFNEEISEAPMHISDEEVAETIQELFKKSSQQLNETEEQNQKVVIVKSENKHIEESTPLEDSGHNQTLTDDSIQDTVTFQDTIRESSVPTPCKICGLEFPKKDLMDHIKFHYYSTVKCDECNMPCQNIHNYRSHIQQEHKDVASNKNWVCKTCNASFCYKPLYIIHFKSAHPVKTKPLVETNGEFPCSYCKKLFGTERKRDVHMSSHKKKQCDICGASITPTNFPAHRRSHLEDQVECPICGRNYKNTVSLKGHIHYTHSQRVYKCEFCEQPFKKSYSLLLHIKREHTGEKSHVCDICGKSFLTFYNLNKHKKMTHLKLRPFQCEYCQKNFSSKFALRTHERQHTMDAPFECELCGQRFRQKVSLKSHKKSAHNIEEPLTCACEVCGKWFSNKFAVMSHMRLH